MSWDVILLKTQTNMEKSLEEVEQPIPFIRAGLIEWLQKNIPQTDCTDPNWPVLVTDSYSVEFNIGEEETECVMLHIRGEEEPSGLLRELCRVFDCRAVDCSTSNFLDFHSPSSFERWKAYRDQILAQGSSAIEGKSKERGEE